MREFLRGFVAIALCGLLGGCNGIAAPELVASGVAATGSIGSAEVLPDEALAGAKEAFRTRNFGISEEKFRRLVEQQSGNAEAWLGLAASYDELRRFDLADRAYQQVAKLSGESVALRNNRGYSYLMRGDRQRARQEFLAARAIEPANPYVLNNLAALEQENRRRR